MTMTDSKASDNHQIKDYDRHLIQAGALDSLLANNEIFEPEDTALCQQLIMCGDRVLDIGANSGYFTLLFCELVSPGGFVSAIEPDRENFEILQANLCKQEANGIVSLHMKDDTLETPLDFIKINITGHKPFALQGLASTLKQSPQLKILCKFSPFSLREAAYSPVEFLKEMCTLGFHLLVKDQQTWKEMDFTEITEAFQHIQPVALTEFFIKHTDSEQASLDGQAVSFLEQHDYQRPVLENFLFVAPGAWQTVCTTLAINSCTQAATTPENRSEWKCRWVFQQDWNKLLVLFKSAFGSDMQADLWVWKYKGLHKQGILAQKAGKVVAYYGGIPRKLWLNGKELSSVQICDVMVAPQERGVLTRNGPFARTTQTYLKAQTGKDKPYRLAFGFPTGRHALLGEKLGMYSRVGTFLEATWSTKCPAKLPFWLKVESLPNDNNAVINKLWQEMKPVLADTLLPQKNTEFYQWRYCQHPLNTYNGYLVSCKWISKPLGIVVVRDHGVNQGLEIMDFIGQPKFLNTLLQAAITIASELERPQVFGWMTDTIIEVLSSPASVSEMAGIYIDPPALNELVELQQAHFWFQGGDTDFR